MVYLLLDHMNFIIVFFNRAIDEDIVYVEQSLRYKIRISLVFLLKKCIIQSQKVTENIVSGFSSIFNLPKNDLHRI